MTTDASGARFGWQRVCQTGAGERPRWPRLEDRKSHGTGIAVYTATYDNAGNRLNVVELDGSRVTYGYDEASQLTSEVRSGTWAYDIQYEYDGCMNRKRMIESGAVTSYSHNAANELLVVQPFNAFPTSMTWDANGNLETEVTGAARVTRSWDSENRLTRVQSQDEDVHHTYSQGQNGYRVKREDGETVTQWVWDQENALMELDGAGAVTARYTDNPGYWGGLVSGRRSATSTYPSADLSANVRTLTGSNGTVNGGAWMTAFGVEQHAEGVAGWPYLFGGQVGYQRDAAGELYVRARWYQALLGQWIGRDPLSIPAADKPFVYAGNRVLFHHDPSGLRPARHQGRNACRFDRHCPPNIVRRAEVICRGLHRPWTGSQLGWVNACIRRYARITGELCNPLDMIRLTCMRNWCTPGLGRLLCERCDPHPAAHPLTPSRCCNRRGRPGVLGMVPGYLKILPPYHSTVPIRDVILCTDTPGRGQDLDPSLPGLPITLIHEIAHACGVDHGIGHDSARQCNDIWAVCIGRATGIR